MLTLRDLGQGELTTPSAAWSAVDAMPAGGTHRTGSFLVGLLDAASGGVLRRVWGRLRGEDREEELLAELLRIRREMRASRERDHELRNAVGGVQALVSLLCGPGGDEVHPGPMVSATTRAELARIQRLLDHGLEPGPIETYTVAPVVEAATLARGSEAVEVDVPPDLAAHGSAASLTHVVVNLLDNCERHAPGSSVSVLGRGREGRVLLQVCDDGPRRVHRPPGGGGAPQRGGIGLAVCHKLLHPEGARLIPPVPNVRGGWTVGVELVAAR